MRAIRVRKRSKRELYAWHFLTDDEATRCGRPVDELQVEQEQELERLPPAEACLACNRVVDGWRKPEAETGFVRQTAESRAGRFSRAGKLHSGPQGGHGRAIRG